MNNKTQLANRLLNAGLQKEKIDYNSVYVLNSIYCKSCDKMLVMKNGVTICLTLDEIVARGETEHNAQSVCPKPQLLLSYGMALLSETLYKELTK